MARRRFFVDSVRGPRAVLRGAEAQHVRRVLRAEPGQQYEISDNHDAYLAEIESLGRDQVSFRILDKLPPVEPPVRLVLFAALVKFDRFEWILEKATELGVERVAPVEAERSEKGLAVSYRSGSQTGLAIYGATATIGRASGPIPAAGRSAARRGRAVKRNRNLLP